MGFIDRTLERLTELIRKERFEDIESDVLEIKHAPANRADWREVFKSANAFLNTRGGVILLGIKEVGQGAARRYELRGWNPDAEPKLKDLAKSFTDRDGQPLDLTDRFPPMVLRDILDKRVALVPVNELPADRKFVYFEGECYKRQLTGDHRITDLEIQAQESFREEAANARELQLMPGLTESDLDITKLNQFIFQLNQSVQIETIKSNIADARAFLERKSFLKNGVVTVLGALVCARYPGDSLGFRSHVHGYVDLPDMGGGRIVQDKQDFVDNVLQLMELSFGYLLRNIQVGVVADQSGTSRPQYPSELLRETVNNALAHRDYSINRQVIVAIKPGQHVEISNPGSFRRNLLIEQVDHAVPVRRVLPEAKPRNPKLADVLRVYRKWEGRGIGMATLVNLCLQDQTDLPYYRLHSEEVSLYLCAGKLYDERMKWLFQSLDGYIEDKAGGRGLTPEQRLVLSYLIKSEWANELHQYTILMTPDNNHFGALLELERVGLIAKHEASTSIYPVYIADRVLMARGHLFELKDMFGPVVDSLNDLAKQVLGVVYRFNNFSKSKTVSAKQASYALWHESGGNSGSIQQFDSFYRRVRRIFNKLAEDGFVQKPQGARGYELRTDYRRSHLF